MILYQDNLAQKKKKGSLSGKEKKYIRMIGSLSGNVRFSALQQWMSRSELVFSFPTQYMLCNPQYFLVFVNEEVH